jgi:hypothetical protein
MPHPHHRRWRDAPVGNIPSRNGAEGAQ